MAVDILELSHPSPLHRQTDGTTEGRSTHSLLLLLALLRPIKDSREYGWNGDILLNYATRDDRGEDVAWNILREIHATYTYIISYKCREVCLYYGQQTRERSNMQSECEGMGCGEWNGHIGQTTRIVLGRFLFLIVDYTVQFSSRRIYSLPGNDSFYPLGINSFQMNHDLRFAAFGNRPSTQTRLPFRSKI